MSAPTQGCPLIERDNDVATGGLPGSRQVVSRIKWRKDKNTYVYESSVWNRCCRVPQSSPWLAETRRRHHSLRETTMAVILYAIAISQKRFHPTKSATSAAGGHGGLRGPVWSRHSHWARHDGGNITLEGIPVMELPVGTQLLIGQARVEATEIRNPCLQLNGIDLRLLKALVTKEQGWARFKAGVMAHILQGGWVRPSEQVTMLVDDYSPEIDDCM